MAARAAADGAHALGGAAERPRAGAGTIVVSVARLNLLIDADDTLWENNIYFEQAFADFCAFLDHSSLSPPEVRAILDEIEIANIKVHGYGSLSFGRNLRQCYQRLAEREIRDEDLETVTRFAQRILDTHMEVI